MSDRWLFWLPTLIWASTWHVILHQFGVTPVLQSVAMRFALAALLLVAVARWQRARLRLPARAHGWMVAAGIVQYGGNYWAVYEAERHVPSGLVAVLFSLMVFGNALGGWLAFGQRVGRRFVGAAGAGTLGVALIFWPEIAAAGARPTAAWGLALGLGAVACACIGNVLTLTLTRRGLPLVPVLAWCMGYGALFLTVTLLLTGQPWRLDPRPAYWAALLYLAVCGTVVAFLLYFQLAQRQGPARAALMGVIIPVIALAVSAALEGWLPGAPALAGMALCLGSVWVATRR